MKTLFTCKHKRCSNLKHAGLGYCGRHYYQYKKHGRTFDITCMDFNEVVDCGNHYELILLDRKMNENGRAKIDKEDLAKVKAVGRWSLNDKRGYVVNGRTRMHRLILGAEESDYVDHKETGIEFRSDNRKSNLRLASNQENSYNTDKPRTNTSGFKGVSYYKRDNNWVAKIMDNGKRTHLGYFATPEEAHLAYQKAALRLHGEFIHKSLLTPPAQPKRKRFYYAPGAYSKRKKVTSYHA